jgi:hypothetical protein
MDRYGIRGNGQAQAPAEGRRAGRATWSAVMVAAFALLLPASLAEARIVPQKGIQGINLNMTRAQVVQKKGQPDEEKVVPNEILGQQRIMRYGRTRAGFSGAGPGARVVGVTTRARRQRTRSGVGVGSTEAAVRAGVRGIRCRTEFGSRHCFKGRFRPGERVTDFSLSEAGRVTRVTVAFVID